MQKRMDAAHDLHFLLKEAALDGYTSMARWLGELEGSVASVPTSLPVYNVSFASALNHVKDILAYFQECEPELSWNKGQKDASLYLLKPFCQDTMKLKRKMDRITTMLQQNFGELERTLRKFANEESYLQDATESSMLSSGNVSSTSSKQGSICTLKSVDSSVVSRRRVPTAIWKFLTCQLSNPRPEKVNTPKLKTNLRPASKKQRGSKRWSTPASVTFDPSTTAADTIKSTGPGTDAVFAESATEGDASSEANAQIHQISGIGPFAPPGTEPDITDELEQLSLVMWSDQRLANWLEEKCILSPTQSESGVKPNPSELLTQIVSKADSTWFPDSANENATEQLKTDDPSNELDAEGNTKQIPATSEVKEVNEEQVLDQSSKNEFLPLDPFSFLKATVRDLRTLVVRITYNLRLVERNFYAPPSQIMKLKREDCRDLRDYVAVVKEIGNSFQEGQKASTPQEIELCQLLGSVYHIGVDCVKHFEKFSTTIEKDASFLLEIANNYRQGSWEEDYELNGDITPLSDLEPKVFPKLQELFTSNRN